METFVISVLARPSEIWSRPETTGPKKDPSLVWEYSKLLIMLKQHIPLKFIAHENEKSIAYKIMLLMHFCGNISYGLHWNKH